VTATEVPPNDVDDDSQYLTPAELAAFAAELNATRNTNELLQAEVASLTLKLGALAVDTGYVCHDCPVLQDELQEHKLALNDASELLFRERALRAEKDLEVSRLQAHCKLLSTALDEANLQLVVAQSAVAAHRVSHSAPPAALSGVERARNLFSPPDRPPFTLSAPASAIPVSARAAGSVPASPVFSSATLRRSATLTSADELNAMIATAAVVPVTVSEERGPIPRHKLPGIERTHQRIAWCVPGDEVPNGVTVLSSPVLTVGKLHTVALKPIKLEVWRTDSQFFEKQLLEVRDLRDNLAQLGLWSLLAAAATGSLRVLEGTGNIDATKRAALTDMLARAQQPFAGFSQYSPYLLVLAESHSTQLVYVTYEVFTEMERLLYELLRKAASVELQRELFQHGGALSSYSALAGLSHLSFTAQFRHSEYKKEVRASLGLKYATKLHPTFAEWLRQLSLRIAFFNTAFASSECCEGSEFADFVHSLLGTSLLTRATIDQFFPRGPDKRIKLSDLRAELQYFTQLEEFFPSMTISANGNTATVGAVHPNTPKFFREHLRIPPTAAGAATQGRRTHASEPSEPDVCRRCSRPHDQCSVCQFCLMCDHSDDDCPHVNVAAADAEPPYPRYVCPRCKQSTKKDGGHWAVHCNLLTKDLLQRRFHGKSYRDVLAMVRQSAGDHQGGSRKQSLVSFGKLVKGEIKKSFRKAGNDAVKDPAVRARVIAHLVQTMEGASDSASTTPAPGVSRSTAPTRVHAVDADFIQSLERQYAEATQRESLQHRARG
jgi:hypothetical protein